MANRADVTTEEIEIVGPAAESREMTRRAGMAIRPHGCMYKGSAVVHFYEETFAAKPTYKFATLTMLEDVAEGQADWGEKALKEKMMSAYGRKPANRRGE